MTTASISLFLPFGRISSLLYVTMYVLQMVQSSNGESPTKGRLPDYLALLGLESVVTCSMEQSSLEL